MPAVPHPLFSGEGHTASAAEVFAALPYYGIPVSKGWLVRKRALGRASMPQPGRRRRIPSSPGVDSLGVSVREIAASTEWSTSTVRRNLNLLAGDRLVFNRARRWWRTGFDPDEVTEELGIRDTVPALERRFSIDRDMFYGRLSNPGIDGSPARVVRSVTNDGVTFTSAATSEVVWRRPLWDGD